MSLAPGTACRSSQFRLVARYLSISDLSEECSSLLQPHRRTEDDDTLHHEETCSRTRDLRRFVASGRHDRRLRSTAVGVARSSRRTELPRPSPAVAFDNLDAPAISVELLESQRFSNCPSNALPWTLSSVIARRIGVPFLHESSKKQILRTKNWSRSDADRWIWCQSSDGGTRAVGKRS
ncbi:hypothetical protein BDZ45DRAFT_806943 [Acephala macrosclerotiorum]|nr:hypothetical protein BDZ45DRAFT_806943 [Acephala macrosclerotiorum]